MSSLLEAVLTDLRSATPDVRAEFRAVLGIELGAGQAPGLQDTADAAARLDVAPKTVALWCREGRIDGAVQVGNSWRIPADATPAPAGDGRALPARPSKPRARSRKTTVADRIGGTASARIRGAGTPRSGPGDAPTSRDPAQTSGARMDSTDGTRRGDATNVIPIRDAVTS